MTREIFLRLGRAFTPVETVDEGLGTNRFR